MRRRTRPSKRGLVAVFGLLAAAGVAPMHAHAAAAVASPSPAPALAALAAPPGTVAYGGVPNLAALFGTVRRLAESMAPGSVPPIDPSIMLLGAAAGLDLEPGFRFAVLDPARYDEPVAIIVTLSDKKVFLDALPAPVKKRDRGNAISWTTEELRFGNFIGKSVVVTWHPNAFRDNAAFLKKLAATALPADVGVAAVVPVAALVKKHGALLDAGLAGMKAEMEKPRPGAPPPGTGGAPMPDVSAWMGDMVRAVDQIVLTAQLGDAGLSLRAHVKPRPGSGLASFLGLAGARGFPLVDRLPADTAAFVTWGVDAGAFSGLLRPFLDWSATSTFPPIWRDTMKKFWDFSTGEGVMGLFTPAGTKTPTVAIAMGVNEAAARTWLDEMRKLMSDPAVKKLYADLGMEVKYVKEAYKVAGESVTTTTIKRVPRPGEPALSPEAARMIDESFGSSAMLVAKGMTSMAFGKSARGGLETLMAAPAGKLSADPGVRRALDTTAPGAFMLLFFRTAEVMRAVEAWAPSGTKGAPPAPASPRGAGGYALSFGASGGALTIGVELPSDEMALSAAAFRRYVDRAKAAEPAPAPAPR